MNTGYKKYIAYKKQDSENATISVLLCSDKNDALVKISLPEYNRSIIASKYQLYLPNGQQLLTELKKASSPDFL